MIYKECLKCKRRFYKKVWHSNKYWKIRRFCSIKCSGTLIKKGTSPWNKGKKGVCSGFKNPAWKGGKTIATNGYIMVCITGTGTYRAEHRIVMEKKLGRKLERWEVIHHKNHNRQDNRIENLELMIKNTHDRIETKNRWENNPESFNTQ